MHSVLSQLNDELKGRFEKARNAQGDVLASDLLNSSKDRVRAPKEPREKPLAIIPRPPPPPPKTPPKSVVVRETSSALTQTPIEQPLPPQPVPVAPSLPCCCGYQLDHHHQMILTIQTWIIAGLLAIIAFFMGFKSR